MLVQERPSSRYIRPMCGRFTRQYTWQQLHALYRLTVPAAIPNFQPDYNVCPTDPADVVVPNEGGRDLVRMRWGLVPDCWSKPLKGSAPRDIQRTRRDGDDKAVLPRTIQEEALPGCPRLAAWRVLPLVVASCRRLFPYWEHATSCHEGYCAERTCRLLDRHPEAKVSLERWYKLVRAAHWASTDEVQKTAPKAKVLNRDRVRFEVAGGNYRLVAAFDFRRQIAFVKFIGTHAEYDRIDALSVSQF